MELKNREDPRLRQESKIPIGVSHTRFYGVSEQEAGVERGDVLPNYDQDFEALTGLQQPIVVAVVKGKNKLQAEDGIFVTAIQPIALDGETHASGYMEVRGSRKGGANIKKKFRTVIGVSDGTGIPAVHSTLTIDSVVYYIQSELRDVDSVPGLIVVQLFCHQLE